MKQSWKPGTTIYPLPAVLVSCGNTPEEYNLITVSWVGTLCTNPPMCYISVRPERHSYEILRKNMEFVINLTTVQMAKATDWCGVSSGKNYNKFEKTGLTPKTAQIVKAPYVEESPLCIECKVREREQSQRIRFRIEAGIIRFFYRKIQFQKTLYTTRSGHASVPYPAI